MREGWGDPRSRSPRKPRLLTSEVRRNSKRTGSRSSHTHHYGILSSFYDSYAAQHPRRSCEDLWEMLMMVRCKGAGPTNTQKRGLG